MAITPLPPPPQRAVPATFADLGDAFLGALPTFATEMEAARQTALDAIALTDAMEAVYISAASTTGVIAWVSGTTYAVGDARYSPIDLQTYRRMTAGAGTTDPSLDATNWRRIGASPKAKLHAAGNVTLIPSSDIHNTVSASAHGQSITLPDATQCTAGVTYTLANAGGTEMMVKDSSGTLLGFLHGRTSAILGLTDQSTAAGVWQKSGLLAYGVDVMQVVNMGDAVVGPTNKASRCIDLDGTRKLLLLSSSTETNAVVYDGASGTFGTSALVKTANLVSENTISTKLIAADKVLLIYANGTNVVALVLSVSGTTITVGSEYNHAAGAAVTTTIPHFGIYAVGSTWLVTYATTSATKIVALTVSGTVVTFGAAQTLSTTSLYGVIGAWDMGSGVALVAYTDTANDYLYAKCFTVSGTTLTAGSTASTTVFWYLGSALFKGAKLPSGRVAVSNIVYGAIISVSGTVPAISTVALCGGLNVVPAFWRNYGNQMLVVCYSTTGGEVRANVLTDNAGTAQAGTEATITGVINSYPIMCRVLSDGVAGITWMGSGDDYPVPVKITISGNSPVITKGNAGARAIFANPFGTTAHPFTGRDWYYDAATLSGSEYGYVFRYDKTAPPPFALGTDGETVLRLPVINTPFETESTVGYDGLDSVWGFAANEPVGYQTIARLRIA